MNVIESRKYVGTSLQDPNAIHRQVQMPLVTYSDTDDGNLRRRVQISTLGFERQVTEIDFETNLEYETISLQWRLLELDRLLEAAYRDESQRVLMSPTFKDSSDRTWWLRLRLCSPTGSVSPTDNIDSDLADGLSLYLYTKRPTSSNRFPTRFQFLLSFLDKEKKPIEGVGGHCTDVIFQSNPNSDVDNWGAENIVSAPMLSKLSEMGEVFLHLELKIWLEPITHLILAREVR